jgi:hypothetical protein
MGVKIVDDIICTDPVQDKDVIYRVIGEVIFKATGEILGSRVVEGTSGRVEMFDGNSFGGFDMGETPKEPRQQIGSLTIK